MVGELIWSAWITGFLKVLSCLIGLKHWSSKFVRRPLLLQQLNFDALIVGVQGICFSLT